jgi:hypothetical protein
MPKYRVPIAGTVGKSIMIDTDAIVNAASGATIGTDLKLPDGSVPTLEALALALNLAAPSVLPFTVWENVQEIPGNILELAAVSGEGLAFRNSAGLWSILSNAQVTALVNTFTETLKGAVPPPGAGAPNRYLRADGTWATIDVSAGGASPELFYAGCF